LIAYAADKPAIQILSASPPNSESNSLEKLLLDKVQSLTTIISQIGSEIQNRKNLSTQISYTIDQQYLYLKSYFLTFDQWELGRNKSIEMRRTRLEQQLQQLHQEKRMEQTQCWKDIAQLNKECRTWFKQYRDLMQRVKIVAPGLNPK